MKKSDIIKVLKPQGFVKAVGTTSYQETYFGRYGKGEVGAVVGYDSTIKSYIISKSDGILSIEPVDGMMDATTYIKDIFNTLTDNGIKAINYQSFIQITN